MNFLNQDHHFWRIFKYLCRKLTSFGKYQFISYLDFNYYLLISIAADEDADLVLLEDPSSISGLLAKAEAQYHQGSFEHALKFYYR